MFRKIWARQDIVLPQDKWPTLYVYICVCVYVFESVWVRKSACAYLFSTLSKKSRPVLSLFLSVCDDYHVTTQVFKSSSWRHTFTLGRGWSVTSLPWCHHKRTLRWMVLIMQIKFPLPVTFLVTRNTVQQKSTVLLLLRWNVFTFHSRKLLRTHFEVSTLTWKVKKQSYKQTIFFIIKTQKALLIQQRN